MAAACRLRAVCWLAALAAARPALNFSSAPADDLQPLFGIAPPWLGADVATSIPLSCGGSGGEGGGSAADTYLWLHGDTLTGTMVDGARVVDGMPRNSVALLTVDPATGAPTSGYRHAVRPASKVAPAHVGFWSPANASQWYWPTSGACVNGSVTVLAMRIEDGPPGLFPFVQVSFDAIQLGDPAALPADPLQWPAPPAAPLPNQNASFLLGNAVGVDQAGGWVYLLGAFGPSGNTAMLARVSTADWAAQRYAAGTQYWTGAAGGWQPFSATLAPAPLFPDVPSETTLAFHPLLGWYIVVVNYFTQGATVTIRTSPGTKDSPAAPGLGAPVGPWSEPLAIYTIPAGTFAGGAFCYAGKAHPELSPPQAAGAGEGEFVWSYMCNTPGIPGLLNRTDIYVPQLVRTKVAVLPGP